MTLPTHSTEFGYFKIISDGTKEKTYLFTEDGIYCSFSYLRLWVKDRKKQLWRVTDVVECHSTKDMDVIKKPKILIDYVFNRRSDRCVRYEIKVDGFIIPDVLDLNFEAKLHGKLTCTTKRVLEYDEDDEGNKHPARMAKEEWV